MEWLTTAPAGQGTAGGKGEGEDTEGAAATEEARDKSKGGATMVAGEEHAASSCSNNHGSTAATYVLSQ